MIEGHHDAYIREFAEAAKAWGHPFFLRFNWEMNGNWFRWSEGVNGNQAGEYVAAWRHVHDIFTQVGATNATWVWCPNVDPESKLHDLASLYPGDEYVDWTGLDGYNWGTNPARPDRWRSFDDLFKSTYDRITETIAPGKPLIISEVGSLGVRRLQGRMDRQRAGIGPDQLPAAPRPALVREVRRRHGLADRDLEQLRRRLRRRHPEPVLPRQYLRLDRAGNDPTDRLIRSGREGCP